MIDLKEPVRKEYSDEEQRALENKFFVTLHLFLIGYLALHNLIIPVIANLFRGDDLLTHVHFWFLVHLPVHLMLKKESLPKSIFFFLLAGTITRVALEVTLAPTLLSWGIMSIFISEISSLLFYFFYASQVQWSKGSIVIWSIFGILLSGSLVLFESWISPHAQSSMRGKEFQVKTYGCQGSTSQIVFPLSPSSLKEQVRIVGCGFEQDEVRVKDRLDILNQNDVQLNLRVYRLKWSLGKISWHFVRLIQLPPGEQMNVDVYLKERMPLLLKVPERKKLGHLLVVPEGSSEHFPVGELKATYDSLKWVQHE